MFLKPSKLLLAVALTGVVGTGPFIERASAQAAPATPAAQPAFKDRAEYDLFEAIRTGTDPAAALVKLDEWKKSYPETQFASARLTMYLQNYVKLNKVQDLVNTAKEILKANPNDFTALYYMTLYTQARVPAGATTVPPDILDDGDKAAHGMLENLDKQKPANVTDAQWDTTKKPIAAIGHTTLGWIAMQRKQNEVAETEFKLSLTLNPANGDVCYWLGVVEVAQKKIEEKGSELLFYLARAATLPGTSPGIQSTASTYFEKAYVGFHGDKTGIDQVKETAKNNPAPPPGWKIENVKEIAQKKLDAEKKADAENPELAKWKGIKAALVGTDGANYFNTGMKDAELPTLKGKVVKLVPETNPKTIVLACEDGTTGDATLTFEAALPGKVEPGTELTFEGVAKSYTADPFMVTFAVEKDKLHGWTGTGAPKRPVAPVRRPVPPKK